MTLYDEIAPDMVSPHDDTNSVDEPLKHLDTVIALYDFPGTQPSHLPLNLGDTVYVLSKSDSGWWDGVIICNNGEIQRGWFPPKYVRSVNYVQPVLNKLKSNKEIDSITAANTAANVLIPSFTTLLQKNLLDTEKSSSRKNSVVSFASSETSIPSDSKNHAQPPLSTPMATPTNSNTSIRPGSQAPLDVADSITCTSVEVAERLALQYKQEHGVTVTWIPRNTTSGDFLFYCEQLMLFCEYVPMMPFDPTDFPQSIEVPSKEAILDQSVLNVSSGHQEILGQRAVSTSTFDPMKRDSNASSFGSNGSNSSSYHHFSQPFYAMNELFYKHPSDLSTWSEVNESFNYLLDLSFKTLRDHNKQLFSTHFFRLNKVISVVFSAARLTQDDFIKSKYEKIIRKRLKTIASSFAQIYINGILHLSAMHYSLASSDQLFTNDITRLNKSTGTSISTIDSPNSSLSPVRQNSSDHTTSNNLNSLSNNLRQLELNDNYEVQTYFQQIEIEVDILRRNMNSLTSTFIKLTKGKRVKRCDYDSSDASEDEGEDCYNILPQVYPRFISEEFNGGNWCNPFFNTKNPVLNVSGDDLKNRYHSKVIIDQAAYDSINHYTKEMVKLSKETLEFLNPNVQDQYFNETLKGERDTQILRLIYKYLFHASSMIDLIESFDFTVFCLIKRYSSDSEMDNENHGSKDQKEEPNSTSNSTFDYPVVLEFMQLKQQFHDLILKLVMATQSLTLEDPEVFKGLKDEDPLFYNRDVLKMPTEKAALLLTNLLVEQMNEPKGSAISLNPDTLMSQYLEDGISFFDLILTIVQQLIEERETILNYSTRVMHDDLNVQLLVIERNNTMLSEKSDEGHSYYSGGPKKSNDLPWYLEGDDEYDLLLDMKGNIKGGTKEALVSHLIHHDLFDSNFNSAFLLMFSSIMSLGEFIGLMINRFNIEAPEGLSYEEYNTWISKKQNPIKLRVMNIMKLLLEKHWSQSYYNEPILRRWLAFSQQSNVQAYSIGVQLSSDLVRVLNGEVICTEREPVVSNAKPPAPLTKGSLMKKLKLLDIDYVELARQLSLREFRLYSKITKFACLAKVWGKKSGLNESIQPITAFIKTSNQLTNYVAYMILRKPDTRKRVQIIRFFVQVAEKCRQYNNFSSMTAIISALYSSPIHRLKKTWKYLSPDTMAQLQNMNKLMNSLRNFNEYRDVLKFIGSDPCVPFFGVFLSDLTFVYHGNADYLMNRTRMINFAKRAKTCEIVSGIDRFKATAYNFQEVAEIQNYLESWFDKCPTIEEQYQLSLNLEPREVVQHGHGQKQDPASSHNQSVSSQSTLTGSAHQGSVSTVNTGGSSVSSSKYRGPSSIAGITFKSLT